MKIYDLAVIGSGPAGYAAALYASRYKLSVCVIEKDLVGGTCLNRGCIPTKSLLHSASLVSELKYFSRFGVEISGYRIDFPKMMSRKNEVVLRLRTGLETLFKGSSVDLVKGAARITSPGVIEVDGKSTINAGHIIIATGSSVSELPNIKIDNTGILSSDGILDIENLPQSIAIVGGGVIGCEFANLFNALGSKVTIIELMERIIPTQSREASKKLEMIFKKRGIDIYTSSKVESIGHDGMLAVKIEGKKTVNVEKALIAVGRTPNTDGLGLELLGIKMEKRRVVTDEYLGTNIENIYAVGDCVSGPLLAHKASYDGILACDNIMGKKRKVDYSNIPSCIWTDPEVASIGLTEEEAKAKYQDARIAKFPYLASGKAYILGKSEGFAKIIGDSKGTILGAELLGAGACDLIGEAVLARTMGINIKDWARVVHGHPTLSEIFQEAAYIFCGTPIHSV